MSGRLRALDGLRGALALYILLGHTAPFLRLPPACGWIAVVLSHGRGAVELFFVLSGMVILRSLGAGTVGVSAGRFLAARAGRLLPVYALALALAVVALSCGNPFVAMPSLLGSPAARDIAETVWPQPWFAHLAAHIALIQGALPPALLPDAEFTILGPAWSLSTEWQFYLVVAAMLAIGRRIGARPGDWRPYAAAMMLLGLAGLSANLLPTAWQPGRAFLPHEAWYFALGIASHGLWNAAGRPAGRWWAVTLLAAIFLPWQQPSMTAMVVPLLWTACLICEAPRVPRPFRPLARMLNAAPLQWFGRISYPLYLIHLPVQRLLMLAVAPASGGSWARFSLLWGPLAILLPVVVAHALHHLVELPCWRWSRARADASQRTEPALVLSFTPGG